MFSVRYRALHLMEEIKDDDSVPLRPPIQWPCLPLRAVTRVNGRTGCHVTSHYAKNPNAGTAFSIAFLVAHPLTMLLKGFVGLTVLASTTLASNFFVHEDVLAHPMFSISLGQTPISNSTAQQLLKAEATEHSEFPNPSQQLQRVFNTEGTHVSFKLNRSEFRLVRTKAYSLEVALG